MKKGVFWVLAGLVGCAGGHEEEAHSAAGDAPEDVVTIPPPEPLSEGIGVRYRVSIPQPQTHMLTVEMTFDAEAPNPEVYMAAWTPGSYLIREYVRNVEAVEAFTADGASVPIQKIDKATWRVEMETSGPVTVRYQVYAREMSVRTNFVDDSLLMLNGAPTFMTPRVPVSGGIELVMETPFEELHTGLRSTAPFTYVADDYDELVDSPVVGGAITSFDFEVGGVPHHLVHVGCADLCQLEQTGEDVKALVEAQVAFWGSIPYEEYTFLNVITNARGGLEHLDSTLMLTGSYAFRGNETAYTGWLGLVSHEFFHTWNVKRLRPVGLGPFNYREEVYTPSLWIAEGITSYYDDLMLVRAGLMDSEAHIGALGSQFATVRRTPGRKVRSLTEASYDAWIKYYRRDENSVNTGISYYGKGAVVSWIIDTRIRVLTNNRRSLDDAMALAWTRFPPESEGYTEAQFREILSEVAGQDLSDWLAELLDGRGDLDLTEVQRWHGVMVDESEGGDSWLGVQLDENDVVTQVRRETPAWLGGVNVGDEILAVGDLRTSGAFGRHLEFYEPGDKVELLISRRGKVRSLELEVAAEPPTVLGLSVSPMETTSQMLHRKAWQAAP